MTTSRKVINLGIEFAVTISSIREQDFEVTNLSDAPFDFLKCQILNSTSWSPPHVYVIDEINKVIKIKFTDTRIPVTTPLSLCVQGVVKQKIEIVENKVLLDGAKTKEAVKNGFSSMFLYTKRMFLAFLLMSILFYFVQGTTFGDFIIDIWAKINAAKVVQMADTFDPRILTNKHPLYETADFTELNAVYKRNFGAKRNLSKIYSFVGNDFFVTNDLITDRKGEFLQLSNDDADDYCSMIGGRLLELDELKAYLAGEYLTVENFIWPVSLRAGIPEWSSSKVSRAFDWDDYYVYFKTSSDLYAVKYKDTKSLKNGYKAVGFDDGKKFAFRCGFEANLYMPAR